MKNVYIATSTLNFNNLLSTESISPKSFYINRKFGYKRFNTVRPNPFTNYLIAYEKIPLFSIDDDGLDNYPLIIELSTELLDDVNRLKSERNNTTLYQISNTIYFHPNKVRFLFFSEKHKKTTLIKTEPSIETKLLPIYSHSFQVISTENDSNNFEWDESLISNLEDVSNERVFDEILNDEKLDRIKGFFYSYYLGIILSSDLDSNEIIGDQFFRIKSLIHENLVNHSDGKIRHIKNSIKNIIKQLNEFDDVPDVPMDELIESLYIEQYDITEKDKLFRFLKHTTANKYLFYDQLQWSIQNRPNNNISLLFENLSDYLQSPNSSKTINLKINRLDKLISSLELNRPRVNLSNISETINFNAYKITQFEDRFFENDQSDMYRNIVNDLLDYPLHDVQAFKGERVDLALKIGDILSEHVKNWNVSNVRTYFNSLLDNLESFKPFDLKSHSDKNIQSIILFIQKGEDPETLIKYLIDNEITDFRTALGIWGSIFGFSALPKTLTDKLFSKKYQKFTSTFYQDAQKKIHDREFMGAINIQPVKNQKKITIESNDPNDEIPPHCPKCGAKMVLRHGQTNQFYGCSNYHKTGCKGSRDYPLTGTVTDIDTVTLILDYVTRHNGYCKVSEMNKALKKQSGTYSYNVGEAVDFIKSNIADRLVISTCKKAKVITPIQPSPNYVLR